MHVIKETMFRRAVVNEFTYSKLMRNDQTTRNYFQVGVIFRKLGVRMVEEGSVREILEKCTLIITTIKPLRR